jgi:hypothetical protein
VRLTPFFGEIAANHASIMAKGARIKDPNAVVAFCSRPGVGTAATGNSTPTRVGLTLTLAGCTTTPRMPLFFAVFSFFFVLLDLLIHITSEPPTPSLPDKFHAIVGDTRSRKTNYLLLSRNPRELSPERRATSALLLETEKAELPTGRRDTNVRTARANFARRGEDVERIMRGVGPRVRQRRARWQDPRGRLSVE